MFHAIPCSQINFEDTTFLMSYPLESAKIVTSVGTIGVLQPIIISGCGCAGQYQLIAGFKRVYACRKIGVEMVNAYIYQVDPENSLGAFALVLSENASHRTFNAVEKALILTKLVNQFHCEREDVIRHYLPLLELAPNAKVLDIYLQLTEFDEEIKQFIAAQEWPMSVFELLTSLASDDRRAVFTLIASLKLGVNKIKEFVTELSEIALRDHRSIQHVLADPEIQEVLRQEQMPVPQKADQLRRLIRVKRYPQLTALEREYLAQSKHLSLPRGLQLQADPFFEADDLSVAFRFQTPEELKTYAEELLKLSQKTELQELLSLIKGERR